MTGLYVLLGGLVFVVVMIGLYDWLTRGKEDSSQHRPAR
jgi:hypothetical protein